MTKHNYTNRLLIKLKRQYSHNEVIDALSNRLKIIERELGKTISERDELKHYLKDFKKKEKQIIHIKKSYKESIECNKKFRQENKLLINENKFLIKEIQDLKSKIY